MQQQQQPGGFSVRESTSALYMICLAHVTCFSVFLRHSFGREALGIPGVMAMVFWFLAAGVSGDLGFLPFIGAWFIALIAQRARTIYLVCRGWREHSLYSGYPWLAYTLFPGVKNEAWAKAYEGVICFLVGTAVMGLNSEPLGVYIALALPSHLILRAIDYQANLRAVQDLIDGGVRQQQTVQRWLGERDDF